MFIFSALYMSVADHRLLCRIRSYMVFVARCYALSRPWRHAVSACLSVCPSVRPSRSCILSKRVNISSKFFSPWRSHTIVVFSYQSLWQYSDGDPPPNGGIECRSGMKKSSLFSVFSTSASLHRVLSTVWPSGIINRVSPDRGKLVTLIAGVCVEHSSEAHVAVLLWPFVAAIDRDRVTMKY